MQRATCRLSTETVLVAVVLLLFCGASCGGEAIPTVVLEQTNTDQASLLYELPIKDFTGDSLDSTIISVIEVDTIPGVKERRAYLTGEDIGVYVLGTLQSELGDAPVESLFFRLGDKQFALIWVDESVQEDIETVALGRPEVLPSDDSMRVLRVGGAVNRVAILPFFSEELDVWNQISTLLIDKKGPGFAVKQQFEPPMDIESYIRVVDAP